MKILGMTLIAAVLCACGKQEQTNPVTMAADETPRKPRATKDDAGSEPGAEVPRDDASDDDASDDDASDDDTSAVDPADDEVSTPAGDDDVDFTPEPEPSMEDMVDFGGGGEVVVVEPSAEPAAPDEPAEDEPVPDEPLPDEEPVPEEPSEPPLMSCAGVMGSGDGTLIDDFEDTDLETLIQDQREASWFYYDDETDGTHTVLIDPVEDENRTGYAIHVSGGGFVDWGSGLGVGLRWATSNEDNCVYDASYYTGVRFWIVGNGATVRVQAMNPAVIPDENGGTCTDPDTCWDNHGVDVVTDAVWTEVFLPFSEFNQRWTDPPLAFDPTRIFTLEFTLAAYEDYDLWIDDLGFYVEGEELPAYSPNVVQTTE